VFKTLVDGEDYELAGAAEVALQQDAGEIGFRAGIIALVVIEDCFYLV
jgi:hypothetical protein